MKFFFAAELLQGKLLARLPLPQPSCTTQRNNQTGAVLGQERNLSSVLLTSHELSFLQVHMELLNKGNKSIRLAELSFGEVTKHSPFPQVKITAGEGGSASAQTHLVVVNV